MMGWRGRLGFLVPPGNPTMEPELMQLVPDGVGLYFTRMVAHGTTGSLDGQEERNRAQIAHLDENVELLAHVKPSVVVMGHTATSYTLGKQGEAELKAKIEQKYRIAFTSAFESVVTALTHLGIRRVAYATPYNEATTLKGKSHLESCGFEVVAHGMLPGVTNIYDESAQRAYQLARMVDVAQAQAVFLSGVGMPTIETIDALERDLGKPVLSSTSAMMWNALRIAGVHEPVKGAGRLLAQMGQ
ncbi:MAG TPA: hypothetical protein VGN52_23025 [Burkholderiales bacterium]